MIRFKIFILSIFTIILLENCTVQQAGMAFQAAFSQDQSQSQTNQKKKEDQELCLLSSVLYNDLSQRTEFLTLPQLDKNILAQLTYSTCTRSE